MFRKKQNNDTLIEQAPAATVAENKQLEQQKFQALEASLDFLKDPEREDSLASKEPDHKESDHKESDHKEPDHKESEAMEDAHPKVTVTMIHNPLPTPKKHVPKEMNYDYEPPASEMHFDLVNMTGIDYFDIN